MVHVTNPDLFAIACGQTVMVHVAYAENRHRFPLGESEVIIGEAAVRRERSSQE